MMLRLLSIMLLFCWCAGLCHAAGRPALLPLPERIDWHEGTFVLDGNTRVRTEGAESEAKLLASALKSRTRLQPPRDQDATGKVIELVVVPTADTPREGYRLSVDGDRVRITSPSPAGIFYGTQTLLQLIRKTDEGWTIPRCEIADQPRFGWRGLMLDEARHFMGKAYVLHLLDTMAAHKLNTLHWHLTDDQGWRIEIKAYPKLTSVGAWRGDGEAMPTPDWDRNREGHPDGARYGGFYTQEDIKDIVAYASERHIRVIPEVDVPGHARAITTAYPETIPRVDRDTGKSVHGLRNDVISVVREENYAMLEQIFGEIAGLFPAPYIHVGGDEVNVNAWKASPEHRAFMAEHEMTNPHQLQNHFMLRLEKILRKQGRTLVGWNEIMHGGQLSKDTVVMSWIGIQPGIKAARKGYPVIMCPGPHCYFDMKYPGPDESGHWWAGVVDTHRAYDWNPLFEDQLDGEQQQKIQGIQCCLWTEFVPNPDIADYRLWPRACATAEVAWSPQEKRDWADFERRLGGHLDRLDELNVAYRLKPPTAIIDKDAVTLVPPYPEVGMVYTTDGTDPVASSAVYDGTPLTVTNVDRLKYRTLRPNGRLSKTASGAERLPVAWWKPDLLTTSFQPLTFDIEKGIDAPGVWRLSFVYKRGAHKLVICDVRLMQNGIEIARDTHDGEAGSRHEGNTYRLPVKQHRPGDRYEVVADVRSDGGNNSHGILALERSTYEEPDAGAATVMPAYGDHRPEAACDWDRSTYFWSSRKGQKGDHFTLTFDEPVACNEITWHTGKPGASSDIVADGMMEVSPDGVTFARAADFNVGTASFQSDTPGRVKAIRLTLNADHETWIVIRDPDIRLSPR